MKLLEIEAELIDNKIIGKNTTIEISFDYNIFKFQGVQYEYRLSGISQNDNFKTIWINKVECYRWIFTFITKCNKFIDFYIDEHNNVYEMCIRNV